MIEAKISKEDVKKVWKTVKGQDIDISDEELRMIEMFVTEAIRQRVNRWELIFMATKEVKGDNRI